MSYGDSQNDRRDVFAGLAMQSIIEYKARNEQYQTNGTIASMAYDMANAMLAEREKHLTKAPK